MILPAYHGFVRKLQAAATYLLEDLFTTDDAAPVTTPRTCEPTGTFVFTGESNFSISSAQLQIASPGAWNAGGFRDNAIRTRTAGRRFYATFTVTNATNTKRGYFAWNSVAGINFDSIDTWSVLLFANGSTVDIYIADAAGGTSFGTIANIAISTEYQLLIIQRSAGYFVYLKGGAFTNWTMLTILTTGNADVYAAFGNHSLVASINKMAIPNNLWLPHPRVDDSFNSRNGNGNSDYVARYGSNPVITTTGGEPNEQYVPTPIRMGNGDIWIYVKGASSIYAYKSTDNGLSFSIQNGGTAVISPGAGGSWDDGATLEPLAVYDSANTTIHLYYRGDDGAGNYAIGHATAADSNPASFTKDAGNPILTAAEFKTALGLAANPTDLSVNDIIKISSTWYFYGTYQDGTDSKFKIWYGTGTTWDDINPQATVFSPDTIGGNLLQIPTVFKFSGASNYTMIFTSGFLSTSAFRRLRVATSSDGITWTLTPSQVLAPEGAAAWEDTWVYAARILKENTSPFVAPVEISSKYLLYYSGFQTSVNKAQVGLLYLQDNGGDTVEANFPVSNAVYFGTSDGAGDADAGSGGTGGSYDGTANGMWELSTTAMAPIGDAPTAGQSGWNILYEGGSADGVALVKVTAGASSTAGPLFRFTDNNNWWTVALSDTLNNIRILECNAGTLTTRATTAFTVTGGTEYTMVVVLSGATITAWVNNSAKVTYASATLNQTEQTHGLRGAGITDSFNALTFYPLTETGNIGDEP